MIPRVRDWLVIVRDERGEFARYIVQAPTKFLAKLNFRNEHADLWGCALSISPKRGN